MRLPVSRLTAALAILLALASACGLAAAPRAGRDRDRAPRTTRLGASRPDTADYGWHVVEDDDARPVSTDIGPGRPAEPDTRVRMAAGCALPALDRDTTVPAVTTAPRPTAPVLPSLTLDILAPDRAPPA